MKTCSRSANPRERFAFTWPIHDSRFTIHQRARNAFTLIELLIVIIMIAILAGLLYPAINGAQNQAKKAQAKNDVIQIVTAVNAFYTEYGKYPVADADQGTDKTFSASNKQLLDILRSLPGNDPSPTDPTANKYNPRKIPFLQVPNVKDNTNPRAGVDSTGIYYDPWGKIVGKPEAGIYHITIDSSYDNQIANPYTSNAGPTTLQAGVIAWSLGSDGSGGSGDRNAGTSADDVISWQ